ncbi:hypothetical protein [Erythrobacter sp. BLCC-B19]|uniref:hypothetical protein n=1 Tax=Erythrobacter sp. BLCC-B19 TaxID=3025315 RepID=UPI00235E398C|nr:hypothetical protein [Erythrobacter sp. BLCC-B19]WDA42353.1 hypothetical protein PS060_05970 [Erythrobacter sp. BLCC-B19]
MAKSPASRAPARPRTRWGLWLLAIIAAGVGAVVFAFREPINGYGSIASAYSARVACSCRYVAGRPLDDCAKDKLAGMELVTLVEDDETRSVTARFPLVASATATYRKGYGCVLEPWEG